MVMCTPLYRVAKYEMERGLTDVFSPVERDCIVDEEIDER
jgi:hypothetical protein